MPTLQQLLCAVLLLDAAGLVSGCAPSIAQRREAARPSVALLQAGRFDEAEKEAARVLRADDGNPQAQLVAAVTLYKRSMHQLSSDLRVLPMQAMSGAFNHQYMRFMLERTSADLATVEQHLGAAAVAPWVDLELCLACWQVDWNHNGRVDKRDERLFEIEIDGKGRDLPEGDSRRRPTFRFDVGDVYWARALVDFQRGVVELLRAWRWDEVDKILSPILREEDVATVVLHLGEKERVLAARDLFLAALGHADRARREYLAETDDDREWVPSPRQKDHPMPLPVDEALFRTWELVTSDLTRLILGEEGIDIAEAAQLGDHQWERPPHGFVDVGRLLNDPADIEIPLKRLKDVSRDNAESALRAVLGRVYAERMKPSPILGRLARMKGEIDRHEESMERKLRYLFWLN